MIFGIIASNGYERVFSSTNGFDEAFGNSTPLKWETDGRVYFRCVWVCVCVSVCLCECVSPYFNKTGAWAQGYPMALKGHKSDSGSFLYPLVSSVTFAPGGSGRGVQHHLYEKAVAVRHAPLQPPLHPHPITPARLITISPQERVRVRLSFWVESYGEAQTKVC